MNLQSLPFAGRRDANALVLVLVLATAASVVLLGLLGWTRTSIDLAARNNQFFRSQAAAEAATERIIAAFGEDYQNYGVELCYNNLDSYRYTVPNPNENSYWANYEFRDENNTVNCTTVDFLPVSQSTVLSMKYAGLHGFAYDVRIVSNARELNAAYNITGHNEQNLQLSLIPTFQYAIFYDGDLEFNRCAPMTITGPVHCNGSIYGVPATTLDFWGQVTAAGKILTNQKKSTDPLSVGTGTTTYHTDKKENVPSLHLPLGVTNTPSAAHQIIEIPPWTESANSMLGRLRYYNLADLIVLVSNSTVKVTSGAFNNFATSIPWSQASYFVKTNGTFYDNREDKMALVTDIDVDKFRRWNHTNSYFRTVLSTVDLRTIYVGDLRTPSAGNMTGVRLINGLCLPPQGLTIVTFNPLYIQGHYNVTTNASNSDTANAVAVNLGSTDTSKSVGASVVSDCLTILSTAWTDANNTLASHTPDAGGDTTVNAAILSGNTVTVSGFFGGGVHNLPRYLEDWSGRTFTLNTSIVCMYPSQLSVGPFVMPGAGGYYYPPTRNWSFDNNFNNPSKLPPMTPMVRLLVRGTWLD